MVSPKRVLATGSLVLALLVAHYITIHSGYSLLQKYEPDWTGAGMLRLAVSVVAAVLLVIAIGPQDKIDSSFSHDLPGWLFATTAGVSLAVMGSTLVAMLYWPSRIASYVTEGQLLSIGTEVAFAVAIAGFLATARRARAANAPKLLGLSAPTIVVLMAVVAFFIMMEEASWGQHWFGWGTPAVFDRNLQNETNLHNFYTYRFEFVYYSAAVMAFILLPFAWREPTMDWLKPIGAYVPPPAFAIAVLPLSGLMYQTWNFPFYKVWFFGAIIVAYVIARRSSSTAVAITAALMVFTMVAGQVAAFDAGPQFARGHELTEIREFLIATAFAAYAAMLWLRFGRMAQEQHNN